MILKSDCTYFPGDRPCVLNKREGLMCDSCTHYTVAKTRILIIKLDAVGDVLRTTSILHGLKEKHPSSEVTWVTRKSATPLFENNQFVDRVFAYEATETILHLLVETFDIVINLDSAPDSAVLASASNGKEKLGYGINSKGDVVTFNPEAIHWLEMGAFDSIKKKNSRSFQDLMLDICRIKTNMKDIVLSLSDDEKTFAQTFAEQHRSLKKNVIVGLNTGASDRWQLKQWTLEGYEALIRLLLKKTKATILLYGGPLEKKRNAKLSKLHPTRVLDTGSDNSLRQFFALIHLSDIFVTGDTLALHAATALKKKIVALFGPTSAAEIDSYNGQIIKIQSSLDCLVCYKPRCNFQPNCMNSIKPDQLFSIIQSELTGISKR
jgi:ADP-heptose:LPS heptosyltransferase